MITVVPVRLIRSSSSMMPSLVSGSRLPVGSSASSASGPAAQPRARAARARAARAGRGARGGGGPVGGPHRRRVAEGAGDGDALLLATGEFVGQPVGLAL